MAVNGKTKYRYSRLMPYILRRRAAMALIVAMTLTSAALAALLPWPLKILVDYAIGGMALPGFISALFEGLELAPAPTTLIVLTAAVSLGLFAVSSTLEAGLTWVWSASGQRMFYDLAADLFGRLQRLSLLFHGRHAVGDMLNRLTDDCYCIYSLVQSVLITPLQQLLTLVTVGIVAWKLDPELTGLSLVLAPLLGVSAWFFRDRLKRRARHYREARSRMMSLVHQTLTAIPMVQAFGAERRNQQRFDSFSEKVVRLSQRNTLLKKSYGFVNGLTTTAGSAIVMYVGGHRVIAGALSIGTLLVFIAYVRTMQRSVESLLTTYGSLKSIEAGIDRIFEVMDADEEVRERAGAVALGSCSAGPCGAVQLEQVTFGYEPGCPVLRGVSLQVRPGETIAFVGPTGAGKTTLVSLIPRFLDPWAGRVMVDGLDVRDVQLASLRERVALVLQEPFLLPLTVAENIAYGRPAASREEVIEAAVVANADEFIQRLPAGYDTVLGERGATLSGGQKQRLAIARALLKDAPILILDEPTSALDAETEALLLEALQRLMRGRTTFIIAHRLSTIRRADRIVVLENGVIVEQGTHQELLAADGRYARFHMLQFVAPDNAATTTSSGRSR